MSWKRRTTDRRQGYSLRGHLRRLKESGRLPQLTASAAVVIIVAGITFGRCQSSSITGPHQPADKAPGGPTSGAAVIASEKKAIAIFPAELLPGLHPCDPLTTFAEGGGSADFFYTDQMTPNTDGSRTHNVTYYQSENQQHKDNKGNTHRGTNRGNSRTMTFTNVNGPGRDHVVSHMRVKNEDTNCTSTTVTGTGSGSAGHSNCEFDSSPSYDVVAVEDPITQEAIMTVTTTNIVASCPLVATADWGRLLAAR